RTYAWMAILSPTGILPHALSSVGLPAASLLYSRPAVLIAMTYSLLPYMVLTIYSVMRGIDRNLVQAASSLGASPCHALTPAFFPLSLPGVAGGSILVFMLAVGYFITPRLVGGPGDQMIAMVIADEMEQTAEWGFPAALTVVLLVLVLVGFTIVQRFLGDALR